MKILLKSVISLLLLALLGYTIGLSNVFKQISHIERSSFWFAALPAQAVILLIMGRTWQRLLQQKESFSLFQSTLGNLTVIFYGSLVPGRFSGLLGAPFVFSSRSKHSSTSETTGITYLHTALYLTIYGLGSALGIMLLLDRVNQWIVVLFLPVGIYVMVGLILLLIPFVDAPLKSLGSNRLFSPVRKLRSDFLSTIQNILTDQKNQIKSMIQNTSLMGELVVWFTFAVFVFPGLRIYALFWGMGLHELMSPIVLMFVLPAIYSVTVLPLSLGGIGITESSAIGVFMMLGYNAEQLTAIVFLDRFLAAYLPAFLGWVCFSWRRFRRDSSVSNSSP